MPYTFWMPIQWSIRKVIQSFSYQGIAMKYIGGLEHKE